MACCTMQAIKTPVTMQDWKAMFPDFTTLTGSKLFIKKLMAVSLSAITYLRGVFPERAYGERQLCGIKLKLLTENSGIEGVDKFINLLRSCYEAVDKKYLYQLSIGIGTDLEDKDSVLESYCLNFRYRDDAYAVEKSSGSANLTEKDPTVDATFWLLKSIFTVSDILAPLPKQAFLTMKILYNEITPPDYEPPGFEPCQTEKYSFPSNAVKIELGKISTDIHGYKMYLRTSLSKEPLSQILEESILTDSQKTIENIPPTYDDIQEEMPPTAYKMQEDTLFAPKDDADQGFINYDNESEETDCPCACKQDSGMNILTCSACGIKQHAICYGFLDPNVMIPDFHCVLCMHGGPSKSSQDIIYSYDGNELQELCAFRRALVSCSSLKLITVLQLEKNLKCSKQLAKDLIERLEFEGFIRKNENKQRYVVNGKKIINNGYQEYFRCGNKENADNSQKRLEKQTKVPTVMNGKDAKESPNYDSNVELFSDLPFMELGIDKEVEKLNLKGSSERKNLKGSSERTPRRNARRKIQQTMIENDSDESVSQSKKRRCLSTKEEIRRS